MMNKNFLNPICFLFSLCQLSESAPQHDMLLSIHGQHGKGEDENKNNEEAREENKSNKIESDDTKKLNDEGEAEKGENSVLLPLKLNKKTVGKLKELILSR